MGANGVSEDDQQLQLQLRHLKTLIDLWPGFIRVTYDKVTWGDEVEYILVNVDRTNGEVDLSPRNDELLAILDRDYPGVFEHEAYQYMVESNPKDPFGIELADLASVEGDMKKRRDIISSLLKQNEEVLTLTVLPIEGKDHYGHLISNKSRYHDLIKKSERIAADQYGMEINEASMFLDDHIHAAGVCGLQVTISASDYKKACWINDQLIPLGPLMLALTAATPAVNGKMIDSDTRWYVHGELTDDRNAQQRNDERGIPPRISTATHYLQNDAMNDRNIHAPAQFVESLIKAGLENAAAEYFAHVLTRNALLDTTGKESDDALRGHLTTFCPHVRIKIPEDKIPWRVEFRPMECQPSDFENAAFAVSLVMIQQAVLSKIDIQIPMTTIEENMKKANMKNAVLEQEFWFFAKGHFEGLATLDGIFNGIDNRWPGFIPLTKSWINNKQQQQSSKQTGTDTLPPPAEVITHYLNFVSARASGAASTPARWIRTLIESEGEGEGEGGQLDRGTYYKMIEALRNRDAWAEAIKAQ